jgi:hypothetical protein
MASTHVLGGTCELVPIYPDLPPEFANMLLCGIERVNEICVCYSCLPKLWDRLGEYCGSLKRGMVWEKYGRTVWPASELRQGYDLRDILKVMHVHLDSMWNDKKSGE